MPARVRPPLEAGLYVTIGELEPLKDCLSDLYNSYDSIPSSSCLRSGPTVTQCILELEDQSEAALEEIKDLTDHREALDSARYLETSRKQGRFVSRFLQDNHTLTMEMLDLRTRYLSIRFAFLNGMIHKLTVMPPNDISPTYLRMGAFNDWIKHAPIVDEINENLLTVRTRKVRLKRRFLEAYFRDKSIFTDFESGFDCPDRLKSMSIRIQSRPSEMTFMKSDIESVQTEVDGMLRETSVREAEGLAIVGSLLGDTRSFEHRKVDEYIRECLECAPVSDRDKEWSSILVFEDNCPEPYTESVPGANPSRYQEYVKAMSLYICDKLRHANLMVDPLSVFATLEQRILPRVYKQALVTVAKADQDIVIQEKCRKIRGYTQEQIGVPVEYSSRDPLPYYRVISRFKSLVFSTTPTHIMQVVSWAANDIHVHMHLARPGQSAGADAFLPILVYCIIQANLPNLATLVNFLKGFINPDLRYSEMGYYVTCLEGACVYISEFPETDHISSRKYLVFDTQRYRDELGSDGMFVYERDITITGYQLYLEQESITRKHVLFKCCLLRTGNDLDVVEGGIITPGPGISNKQVEYWETLMSDGYKKVFILPVPGDDNVRTVQLASLPDLNLDLESEQLNTSIQNTDDPSSSDHPTNTSTIPDPSCPGASEGWLHVKEGSYTSIRSLLELVISLRRLGIYTSLEQDNLLTSIVSGEVSSLPESAYSRIAIKYGFYLKDEARVLRFLREVQLLLRYLHCLSVLAPVDGVCDELTVTALLSFQRNNNWSGDYAEQLPETGVLCKDTYTRLRDMLKRALCEARALGHHLGFNPLHVGNADRMTEFIRRIQVSLRLRVYVGGSFCAATRAALHRKLYESEVAAWYTPYSKQRRYSSRNSSLGLE